MTYLIHKTSGLPKNRIIGMGGALDSARFRYYLTQALGANVNDVDGMVIGGHGDTTMIPMKRLATYRGVPVSTLMEKETLDKIASIKALIDLSDEAFKSAGTYDVDTVKLVAYASDGSILPNVEIVATNISAKVVLESYSKVVPVRIITTGELVSGKAISSITISFSTYCGASIVVAGLVSLTSVFINNHPFFS